MHVSLKIYTLAIGRTCLRTSDFLELQEHIPKALYVFAELSGGFRTRSRLKVVSAQGSLIQAPQLPKCQSLE